MTQTIILNTVMGPRELPAPEGWEFDKATMIAWSQLLEATRASFTPPKLKSDQAHLNGKIVALARLLAAVLGKATFYWEEQAIEIARTLPARTF
jgi:hypothetical protein